MQGLPRKIPSAHPTTLPRSEGYTIYSSQTYIPLPPFHPSDYSSHLRKCQRMPHRRNATYRYQVRSTRSSRFHRDPHLPLQHRLRVSRSRRHAGHADPATPVPIPQARLLPDPRPVLLPNMVSSSTMDLRRRVRCHVLLEDLPRRGPDEWDPWSMRA
jgi:hypothetical protein